MKFSKSAIVGMCMLPLLLFGVVSSAEAGSCAAGATCTFHLTNTNIVGNPAGLIDISVTVNNTGLATVITVAYVSDGVTNVPLGIDVFGYQSTVNASALPIGWKQSAGGPFNEDGFGAFLGEITNPGGTDLSFSFTLANLVTNFPDNDSGGEFVAHIRFNNSCSLWASDGASNEGSSLGGCTPISSPEPTLLGSLGVGLLGMAIFLARSRRLGRTNL